MTRSSRRNAFYADGRYMGFGDNFIPESNLPGSLAAEDATTADRVHAYYSRLDDLLRRAGKNAARDYGWIFCDDGGQVGRQERWKEFREIRATHNMIWIEHFEKHLEALEAAFPGIREVWWLARAEMPKVSVSSADYPYATIASASQFLTSIPSAVPSMATQELLQAVVDWHRRDGSYLENVDSILTGAELSHAMRQLEATDQAYPVTWTLSQRLIDALPDEKSLVLQRCPDSGRPDSKDLSNQKEEKNAGNEEGGGGKAKSEVAHSVDFRAVRWFGTDYSFTARQAVVVRLLYEHWQAGTPDVGDETLLFKVDPEAPPARMALLFRDHPAWGTMIVAGGTKGTRRLSQMKA